MGEINMRKQLYIVLVLSFLCLVTGSAFAGTINFNTGIPTGWTTGGLAGTSGPITDVGTTGGDSQFGWIDSGDRLQTHLKNLAATLASKGFNGVVPSYASSGSYMLSSTLTSTGIPITMDLNFLTSEGEGKHDFALVYLFQGTTSTILYDAQSNEPHVGDGCTPFTAACPYTTKDEVLGVPGFTAPGTVTLTPSLIGGNPCPVTLDPTQPCLDGNLTGSLPDGSSFGPTDYLGNGRGGSSGWVTSAFTPAAGNYRLLFIVGNDGGPRHNDNSVATALAIDNISGLNAATTPEPGTLLLFGTGVAGLIAKLRRKY
jgi:hypothetical protein